MPTEDVGPWRRRSRVEAYRNPWITILHDEVDRPDGSPGVYGVVHFANLAVGVVAIDETDRILLVGQYRYTLEAWSWEIPEGGASPEEGPLEGARRELAEETGYTAATWQEIGRFATSNSVTDETGFLYLATGLRTGVARPEETEALEVRWLPFDEVVEMVERSEITDAMTQIAILRVARLRAEEGAAMRAWPDRPEPPDRGAR
jgi:8-oxo-dGTP pyrophosphatase MutT (NUDIX family)